MRFTEFITKTLCSVFLVILILSTCPFLAFATDKSESTTIISHDINKNLSAVNDLYSSEEKFTFKNYNIFTHKKLVPFLLSQYTPKEEVPYSKELFSFFPQKEENQLYFHGYAEYAHFLTVDKLDFTASAASIILTGSMMDGYNLDSGQLDLKYVVNSDTVTEDISVNYEDKSKDYTLNSIIPNQIILKFPLKINNSWKQKFSYEGTEYEATTTITSVNGEDNLTKCTTTTIVTDIDGYLNNTYTEVRTYEKGKGLIFFSVSTPLDGSFPYAVFENNLFTYILDKYIEK